MDSKGIDPMSAELKTKSSLNCATETLAMMWLEFIIDITIHMT